MSGKPTISIIIPTYNRPRLVKRAVASALSGAGDFAEVIVVDDGHQPAQVALAEFLTDPRLTLIVNDGSKGASSARNLGARAACGSVLLFLDDDDEIVSTYPARVLQLVTEKQAKWGFAFHHVTASGTETALPSRSLKAPWQGLAQSGHKFRLKIAALSSGLWIDRTLFLDIGGLCTDLSTDEDTDLCCRLLGLKIEPWFENEIAVLVDRTPEISRLTSKTAARSSAENYLRTFERNIDTCRNLPGAELFLAVRAQRMILRSNQPDMLARLLKQIVSVRVKQMLWFKRVVFKLRSRR